MIKREISCWASSLLRGSIVTIKDASEAHGSSPWPGASACRIRAVLARASLTVYLHKYPHPVTVKASMSWPARILVVLNRGGCHPPTATGQHPPV